MKRNKKKNPSESIEQPKGKDGFLKELDDSKLDEVGGGWTPCQCGGPVNCQLPSYSDWGGGGGWGGGWF